MRGYKVLLLSALSLFLFSIAVRGSEVGTLNTFVSGTPALAAEVNDNFNQIVLAVDDNHQRIAQLEQQVEDLLAANTALQAALGDLLLLAEYLNVDTSAPAVPVVRLSGVNLQLVNGSGQTNSANGTGNLLIGYDAPRAEGSHQDCSIGVHPDTANFLGSQTACNNVGGLWASNIKTGSHYLIIGDGNNYTAWAGMVVGQTNTSNSPYASVSGGLNNRAVGTYASVTGGAHNLAVGWGASVSGGFTNNARGAHASISGGGFGIASGARSSISGGHTNSATATDAAVSGGASRAAVDPTSWAAGALWQAH